MSSCNCLPPGLLHTWAKQCHWRDMRQCWIYAFRTYRGTLCGSLQALVPGCEYQYTLSNRIKGQFLSAKTVASSLYAFMAQEAVSRFEIKSHTAPFRVSGCITALLFYPSITYKEFVLRRRIVWFFQVDPLFVFQTTNHADWQQYNETAIGDFKLAKILNDSLTQFNSKSLFAILHEYTQTTERERANNTDIYMLQVSHQTKYNVIIR